MDYKLFIMPILSLIIGAASLFTDAKRGANKKTIVSVLSLALLATCLFGIFINIDGAKENSHQKSQISDLIQTLKNFKKNTETGLEQIISALKDWGVSEDKVDTKLIARAYNANIIRHELINKLPPNYSSNTIIKFYPKDIDSDKVKSSLAQIGLKVKKGIANLKEEPTNALWFGVDVPINEVKFVALTLLRAGINIKTIKPFKRIDSKRNIIEIGSDMNFTNSTTLDPNTVEQTTLFKR